MFRDGPQRLTEFLDILGPHAGRMAFAFSALPIPATSRTES